MPEGHPQARRRSRFRREADAKAAQVHLPSVSVGACGGAHKRPRRIAADLFSFTRGDRLLMLCRCFTYLKHHLKESYFVKHYAERLSFPSARR